MNIDILCSDVVGLVGEPFEIETTSEFDTATITFKVDTERLGDTEFDNLLFLWYDEENDVFVEIETSRDLQNSTLSIETTHFSKYMLVDQEEWFDAWKNAPDYFGTGAYVPYDTVICIDCSGSMKWNDPDFEYSEPGSKVESTRDVNNRMLAIEQYIDVMKTGDKTAIINFGTYATEKCGLTDNKSVLLNAIETENKGETNARAAIEIAIPMLNAETGNNNKMIILLSDGEVNLIDDNIADACESGIKIHTIKLGEDPGAEDLQDIAEATGGTYYYAVKADELEEIYNSISKAQFDLTDWEDNDEDGIPDDFEASGLICSNGQICYTEYADKATGYDTDEDGLADGQEILINFMPKVIPDFCGPVDIVNGAVMYFTMVSDPNLPDSDGDGILDSCDLETLTTAITSSVWKSTDSNYSTITQTELLKLEYVWWMIEDEDEKADLQLRADEIRSIVSSGWGAFVNTAKVISGAAADEFAWFLGGDVGKAERDYWLYEVNKYNPAVIIYEETTFHAIMFVAGIISPSPDDAWRLVSQKASKEMLETVGESGAKKFYKAMTKYAGKQGASGIKKLSGNGIKGFRYEVKVFGKEGAYRLLGNMNENGEIFWEVFERTHK